MPRGLAQLPQPRLLGFLPALDLFRGGQLGLHAGLLGSWIFRFFAESRMACSVAGRTLSPSRYRRTVRGSQWASRARRRIWSLCIARLYDLLNLSSRVLTDDGVTTMMPVMPLNIDDLTVREIREIQAMCGAAGPKSPATPLPFGVGDAVLIRTVTMIALGRVKAIGRDFFTLEDGGWVASTGRFSTMLGTGSLDEFERAPSWFLVGRGAIVDVWPWAHVI